MSKKKYLLALFMLITLLFVSSSVFAKDNEVKVITGDGSSTSYATIEEGMAVCNDGDRIELMKDISIDNTIIIDKKITLDGKNFTINSAISRNDKDMFTLNEGADVTIKNLTLDGKSINKNAYLIRVSGGDLTIEENTVLTGSGFCALFITNGSCTMNGGEIINNKYDSNNSIGAAVTVNSNGIFTFNDGVICDNNAINSSNGSAGIMVNRNAKAYLEGGVVENNRAKASPALTVYGDVKINGTNIINNVASGWAGGIGVYAGGNLVMNDGSIKGNEAVDGNGGGVYVEGYEGRPAKFVLNGGDIIANKAGSVGAGVFGYVSPTSLDKGMAAIEINGGDIVDNIEQTADTQTDGAIYIRKGVNLHFSGSPNIVGTSHIEAVSFDSDTMKADELFQTIKVTGEFSPKTPIVLNIWDDYLIGQTIVEYSDGAEVNNKHFISPLNNIGYQSDKEKNILFTQSKRKVLFKDGLYNTYDDLTYWSFVDDKVVKPDDDAVKKDGYNLEGWFSDSKLNNKWDFEIDKIPNQEGNFILYAKWVEDIAADDPIIDNNTDNNIKENNGNDKSVNTSDNNNFVTWIGIMLVAFIGVLIAIYYLKKQEN